EWMRDKDRIALSDRHNARGIELADHGMLDEAVKEFRKAIELDPEAAHAYDNLGTVLAEKQLYREALSCYLTAIRLDPDAPTRSDARQGSDRPFRPPKRPRDRPRGPRQARRGGQGVPKGHRAGSGGRPRLRQPRDGPGGKTALPRGPLLLPDGHPPRSGRPDRPLQPGLLSGHLRPRDGGRGVPRGDRPRSRVPGPA